MKRAVVLGAGLSGIAASKLLIKNDIEVLLFDNNPKINIDKIKKSIYGKTKFSIVLEDISDEELNDIELCVISPGFPKNNFLYGRIAKKKIPIVSELELAYLYSKAEMCAITGSNGKTTTTTLVGEILSDYYKKNVETVGNIGVPFCEKVMNEKQGTKYAIECSSFQLEDIVRFKPQVAAILNFSPDHLDRYNGYTDYINAKLNIAMNQTEKDVIVLNYEDPILRDLVLQKNIFKAKVVFFSSKRTLTDGIYLFDDAIFFKDKDKTIKLMQVDELKLLGVHNFENVMAAIGIAYYMGVPFINIVETCKNFKSIEHRIEFVREKNGVKYYNDSKGTNPDAAIKAIDAMNGKTILIAGGRDKGIDYGDLIMKIKEKVRYLILYGEAKKKIANKARDMNYNSIIFADTLDEAVDIANSYSRVGDNVLLSPACSSFDMFKNYEERGEKFKQKVMSIK